jgi:NAD(P) transhydrogenase subunit beta
VNIVRTVSGDAAPFLPLFGLAGSFFGCALLCALLVTLPIDALYIPVAASMINAVTGVSVALVGIVLRMPALTVVGMLVGGAGLRLAQLRARSASRTVIAALLGDVGQLSRESRSLDAGDAAVSMNYARKVIVVPGYGLAAAQGQHKLHELMKLLMSAGVEVKVALHPMAGRMPGQMGVILADAHVPDGLILPSADVEDGFRSADLVLVVGASDAVNPSADTIKTLPMFGIPSLDAGMARQIYVIKRGAGAGYSGIANPAFDGDNCHCIYGDAQTVLIKMIDALRVAQIPAAA